MYLVNNKCVTAVKVSNFSGHYLRNRSTLDIGVLGYIGIVQHKEHSPEVLHIPPGTLCIYIVRTYISLNSGTCSCEWFVNKEFRLTASKSCLCVRKAQQYELLLPSVPYRLKCLRVVFIFCVI